MAKKETSEVESGKSHLTTRDLIGIFIIWAAIFGIAWWDMGSVSSGKSSGGPTVISLIPGYFLTKAIILGRV